MRKRILVSLAIIPIVIFATGCGIFGSSSPEEATPAAGTTPSTLAAISELQNSLVSQAADFAKLRSDFDAFAAAPTAQGDKITEIATAIAILNDKMTETAATIAELKAQIAALETSTTTAETTARWYCEVYNLNHLNLLPDGITPEVEIEFATSPSKIQDADDYTVNVHIYNNTTTVINDLGVEVTFTPKAGADVIVNEDDLYLDNATSPYYIWEMEVSTKSDGTCRRITFSTDGVKVPRGVIVDSTLTPGLNPLKLVFTLAYK